MPLMPTVFFGQLFPDRLDPDNPGRFLCRFCGKPTTGTARRYYCSDRCYYLCQLAVSWISAREAVWERDGHKCQMCGKGVALHGATWNGKAYEFHEDVCETHHIIPARELERIAWEVSKQGEFRDLRWRRGYDDPEDPKELEAVARYRIYALVYVLLCLDINNLRTLCMKCHDVVHAADLRSQGWENSFMVAPTYWRNFWEWAKRDRVTRTLDQFF